GAIVNMASVAGAVIGVGNRYAYCASKGAVAGITRSVALDYVGQGIRCNAICPGTVQSPSLDERLAATGDAEAARAADPNAPIEAQAPVAQEQATASAAGRSPGTQATENLDGNVDPRDIVVTGYRRSIEESLSQKREANAFVDVITAEDVGKFPDKNVADSLQRVPGVIIDRD
ncbi:SDR family oxidoreductase, partial [Staphylococcus aureus]|nr:SDR family oxidoreductase [Staphylococcus aureus]